MDSWAILPACLPAYLSTCLPFKFQNYHLLAYVMLDKAANLSVQLVLHWNGDDCGSMYLRGLLWGLHALIYGKHFKQGLSHSKFHTSISYYSD